MSWIALLLPLAALLIPTAHGVDVMITSFTSDPESPIADTAGSQDVKLKCQVDLPSSDIDTVTITDPSGTVTSATTSTMPPSPALYEITLTDVNPSYTGTYNCTATPTNGTTVTANYPLIVCADGYYGPTCSMECSCITGATCDPGNGDCTCSQAVCDKADIAITSFTSVPASPTDSPGVQDEVTLRCQVNIPSDDITSVVLTGPNSYMTTISSPTAQGFFEATLSDVHRSATGTYTCTATTQATNSTTETASKDYTLTVDCADDFYGTNCDMSCNCVAQGSCDQETGQCTCTKAFTDAVCDKDFLTVSLTSNPPSTVSDTSSADDVILRCQANLPAGDISSVTVSYPDSSGPYSMTPGSDGLYTHTLSDVHPSNSGTYTCVVTPTGSSASGQDTYTLTINDVDECDNAQPLHNCDPNAACTNEVGGFSCECDAGYHGDGETCTVCQTDYYGVQCQSRCTCVSSGMPNCNNVDGSCTCTKAFNEATCDKAMIAVTSFEPVSGDAPVVDDAAANDVVMQCKVNLAESDLVLVTIDIPTLNAPRPMTKIEEGVWEYTLQDVHPRDSGAYVCEVSSQPTLSGVTFDDSGTYNLVVVDVDECQDGSHTCDQYAVCTNDATDGGFDCDCLNGFSGDGFNCTDIDECDDSSANNCDANANCTNTVGSFTCTCKDGFTGDGTTCQVCVQGMYGFRCEQSCTCVDPVPGQNDVTCHNTDGYCDCDRTEFDNKACDRRDLKVTLLPEPIPVLDTTDVDNVTWQCRVNLHSRDLSLPVTITYPDNVPQPATWRSEGLYERILNDVMPRNNGTYTCTARADGMMPKTGTFELDVLVIGRIISVSDPVEGEIGSTVQINCTVYTSPGYTIITWHRGSDDGSQIVDSNKYEITQTSGGEFEQISYLKVRNLESGDNGTYLCKAKSNVSSSDAEDTEEVKIIVIEKPVIADISVSALASDQLSVTWDVTFDGNLPPPSCSVDYRILNGDWVTSQGSPIIGEMHVVMNLDPYTDYYVQVQCENKVGSSNILRGGPERTNQSNPSKPQNLRAVDVQSKSLQVTWERPSTENGPIDRYRVTLTSDSDDNQEREVPGNRRESGFDGLKPFTDYMVVVTAFNREFDIDLEGAQSDGLPVKTEQDAPSAPLNVQSLNLEDSCRITWDPPENENGIIQNYTVNYYGYPRTDSGMNGESDVSASVVTENGTQRWYSFAKDTLALFSAFRFRVSGRTEAPDMGEFSDEANGSCTTNPGAPPQPPAPGVGTPTDPEENAVTANTFVMALAPADGRNGPISCYDIIVKEVLEGEKIENMDPDRDYPQDQVTDYQGASDTPGRPYIAVVKSGDEVMETVNVKIGGGRVSRCGGNIRSRRKRQALYDHTGDNGGLKPETSYTAFVRSYVLVDGGPQEVYTSSKFMPVVTTGAGPSYVGVIIGVILAVLIVIVIILVGLIYMKRKQQTPLLRDSENGVQLEHVFKEKEPELTHMVVPPILVEDLSEKVKQKSANDDEVFKNEFKSIPESTGTTTKVASQEEFNREKNRYINIVAYDETRVRLQPVDDVEGSDYINACFVDGYEKPKKFIAAQGPRDDTVLDFWRMIWEQNCSTIIMLTKCLENGREKCAEYWPEEDAIMYDDIIVTLDDVVTCADYVIRKFTMQKSIEGEEDEEPIVGERRTLMQFHFLGWPDFGIPKYPHSMLCFIKRIRHMVGSRVEPGNIVVHCSAGVGRTGTYILIDSMLDMMKKEKKVDIYNVIYSLRSQRNLLVQSLVQYIFIHKALMEEYLYGHTEVDVGSVHIYYQKLCAKKDDDITGVETEYRTVASLPVDSTEQKTGNIEANRQKNRLRQVIPYDKNRVKLERLTGQEHSNYINASFIDGYEHKKAYIAAQGPLPNTMGDFWRLAWENQCSTIVMLTECEEKGQNVCSKYWPDVGETVNHAFLTISVKDQKSESEDYTIRDLEVSTTKGSGTKMIRQYHYHGWPELGTPESSASLVKVIGLAHDYQHDIGRFPVLVHCSAGSGRTGVFIALSYLLQRAKAEGIVDIFQTVRALRQQRPHMVQDSAQYQFCYRAMMEYLDSFDHYANFK